MAPQTEMSLTLREAFLASALFEDGASSAQRRLERYLVDCVRHDREPDPRWLDALQSVTSKYRAASVQVHVTQSLGFHAVDSLVVLADEYAPSPPEGMTQSEIEELARNFRDPQRNPTRAPGGSALYSQPE